MVREATVRKQLQQLERKGVIKKVEDRYVTLVDPRDVIDLFDSERSRAGKAGAALRHLRISSKSIKISPGLAHYTKTIIEEARKLVVKGKRAVALDLLVHTLLPLQENELLWLWHNDVFIYYAPKTHQFRAIKSKEIAELLQKLGFEPGIMAWHILGHRDASEVIHRIFFKGHLSWPWARSISYGLKELGLLRKRTHYRFHKTRYIYLPS